MVQKRLLPIFLFFNSKQWLTVLSFFLIWGVSTLGYWKKYEWNPTSMVNFGYEFAMQNQAETPEKAVLFKGEAGDLGAGYDGQIFITFRDPFLNSISIGQKDSTSLIGHQGSAIRC